MRRLILFDIDGTLVSTRGAGIRAMVQGGRDVFGAGFSGDGVEASGRLDPAIMADMLAASRVNASLEQLDAFKRAYIRRLEETLLPEGGVRPLPGVLELVASLAASSDVVLGLLTGNFPESGEIKVRRAGLDFDLFLVSAWGSDSRSTPPHRHDLPPIAMQRFQDRFGAPVPPERVTIVGDTPHDISCARASGCRSLAVATGRYRLADLESHRPTRLVDELSAVDDLLPWFLEV